MPSKYVGPEWIGNREPEATSHFYCADDECPYSFVGGYGPVPNTRKYLVPGGYICELCAEAYDESEDESEPERYQPHPRVWPNYIDNPEG